MTDTSQKRIIDQCLGVEVGAEDNKLLEGHLELFTACNCEEIVPVFQRQNPSVQQLLGSALLAAKVINQKDPTIGFKVNGSLVKIRFGIEAKIEHGEVQLTSGHNHRPSNANPTLIDRSRGQ